jgi:hypothetical protein
VWTALHEFVSGQDRRRALRAALDLGPGKVEVLIKLADGPMTLREIARAAEIDPPRRQPPQARAPHRRRP